MSRIIVKNIGQNTTEKQLKELFSSKGEVTDVRIIKTTSGKSRQFAFVGFRNENQSKEAQAYFNNSFLHTSKLSVDIAKAVGDKSLELDTKSRYTKNKIEKAKKAADKIAKKELEERKKIEEAARKTEQKKKAKLESKSNNHKMEFMEVMKSRQQAHIWGNDTKDQSQSLACLGVPPCRKEAEEEEEESSGEGGSDAYESDSDDGISKGRVTKVVSSRGKTKRGDSDSDTSSDEDSGDSDSDSDEARSSSAAPVAAMSDMDYLRSKMVKRKEITVSDSDSDGSDDSDDSGDESSGHEEAGKEEEKESEDSVGGSKGGGADKMDDDIDEDGRLFIRNIPFSCVEDEILSLFSVHGTVSQVHLPLDADKKCKGFGFVQFLLPEDAARALKALDGTSFQGRLLHIMLAKQQANKQDNEEDDGFDPRNSHLSSFQQKREAERKKMAHKRDGWNASFVRSDAVVDALSDKYGVARGDILDTEGVAGGEMAVRLAIGETHVIQENQAYFASHGVNIEVLESALRRNKTEKKGGAAAKTEVAKRSTTTLLIKNLPHDLIEAELEDMFTKYGSIGAFLVPKSKTVAVVDFIEPSEARKAFTGLAYRKYHHTPLYLEWAPLNTIDRSKIIPKTKKRKSSVDAAADSLSSKPSEPADNTELDHTNDFSTLFIKNLNFLTDEVSLRSHLTRSLGLNSSDIRTVSLPRKKKGDQLLSMGFGFVEFTSAAGANKMLKRINGSVLDGHQLEAKPSDKRLSSTPTLASHKEAELELENDPTASTKLLVRNIAFQATQEELRGLFATFGAVKRIRIPRKMGGVHRGFAFVDFSSKKEAAMAKKALSNSHLYGRHLVIEYAKEEDENDLSKLREKAASDKQAMRFTAAGGKKRKASDALQSQEEADMADMMA